MKYYICPKCGWKKQVKHPSYRGIYCGNKGCDYDGFAPLKDVDEEQTER